MDARLNNLEKFMLEVKHDVRKINDNLLKVFSLLGPDVKSSQSPIELTSLGKKISEKLNADHYASKLADMVRENVKGRIHMTSKSLVLSMFKMTAITQMKSVAKSERWPMKKE